jgi:hypothetical protein
MQIEEKSEYKENDFVMNWNNLGCKLGVLLSVDQKHLYYVG